MVKASKGELIPVNLGFDYVSLEPKVAGQIRAAANRIREKVKRTIEDIIDVGDDLLAVKEALAHGLFGKWVKVEFGWSDRMARRFMDVAEQFGPKTDMISDVAITPTAAYLLAAPSAPFEAREVALKRAASGEQITAPVAKEILGAARKKPSRTGKIVATMKLWQRLEGLLHRFQMRCTPKDRPALVDHLRMFADDLEKENREVKHAERR